MQRTFMNQAQFMMEVNALFRAGVPTSESIRDRLVPKGTINTARPGQFGPGGIYKYEFNLSCGTSIIVKCHQRQSNAKGGLMCNSYLFPTVQLYISDNSGVMKHVVWDTSTRRAVLIRATDLWRDDQLINWSHIPVQWNSTPIPGQPSI